MKIETSYNLHDTVFFLESGNSVGDVSVRCGMIKEIEIKISDNGGTCEVTYKIIMDSSASYQNDWFEVNEEFLFKNEKDVMKFFNKNMKIQLEKTEDKRERLESLVLNEDVDDLPF